MFSETIEIITSTFLKYYGNGTFFIISILAMIVIFIKEKDNTKRNFLIYYPALIFVVILNPLFYEYILKKYITSGVFYRFFWLIPSGIIIAYSIVQIVSNISQKTRRVVVIIAFLAIIMYSGNFMYTSETFQKVDNYYKVPDNCMEVCDILNEIPIENKKAMVSTDLIGYIRQVDASIKLAYQRRPHGDYNIYEIWKFYNAGDVENLCNMCKEQDVNIIVYDNSIALTTSPEYYGYNLYAQTEHYDIYVYTG